MEIYEMKHCAQNWWRFFEYDPNICVQHKISDVKLSIRENKNILLHSKFITE